MLAVITASNKMVALPTMMIVDKELRFDAQVKLKSTEGCEICRKQAIEQVKAAL